MCFLLIAQVTPPGQGADPANVPDAPKGGLLEGMGFFLPAMVVVMILYFIMMKPQQRASAAKSTPERLANLKKNDRVVTAGGIMGTVLNMRDDVDHITIRIDESSGTKMQVLKQSIVRVLSDEENKDG